jgi:hypothetical protein
MEHLAASTPHRPPSFAPQGLTQDTLGAFLQEPRPPCSKVRFVCVTGGLSGGVLQVRRRQAEPGPGLLVRLGAPQQRPEPRLNSAPQRP